MHRQVLVSLLESVVLLHVVQVVAADHDGALHLLLDHDALQDTASDRDHAGERALLVDVVALDRILRRLEAETDLPVEAVLLEFRRRTLLGVQEDVRLLLKRSLGLFGGDAGAVQVR